MQFKHFCITGPVDAFTSSPSVTGSPVRLGWGSLNFFHICPQHTAFLRALPTRACRRDILWKASVTDLHIDKREIISCLEPNCAYLYPLLSVMRSAFSKIFPQMIKYVHVNVCYTKPKKIKATKILEFSKWSFFFCNEED